MAMEPRNYSMADLFEMQCVYLVPKYQRQYVWSLEDQWEPLWLDVTEISSALYDDAQRKGEGDIDTNHVDSHFLGAVVLKVGGSTPEAAKIWKVIDGQQRITTIQLLMAATYSALRKYELNKAAGRISLLIKNSTGELDNKFKISHKESSYEQFSNVMRSINSERSIQLEGNPMVECYRYFCDRVEEWFQDRKDNSLLAANALIITLISKLRLVAIYLDQKDPEHLIFESLNARGEPLTEWDKIKNYLLHKSDSNPNVDQDEIYERSLIQFDETWWREYEGRGAQQRPRTDIFADYWLESRLHRFVGVKRVYKEFKKYIDNRDQDLESEIQQFFCDAEYFRKFSFIDYNKPDEERKFHNHRISLSIGAIWPLLLHLQRMGVSDPVKQKIFVYLDSYFVRRKICNFQARSYDQVGIEILSELESSNRNGNDTAELIRKRLFDYTDRTKIWPRDQDVRTSVEKDWLPRNIRTILLRAIENRLSSDSRAGGYFVKESIHIEHLMPESWEQNWSIDESTSETLDIRNRLIQTMGNLTMLNGPLNSSLQNSSWCVKREEIKNSDNLFINKILLEEYYEDWNENTIRLRGESIAEYILQLWPCD